MKLIIVSGLSGSGKSTVLHVLEDVGYFCVDNLPIGLLSSFASQMKSNRNLAADGAAVGIDARNPEEELKRFPVILNNLKASGVECEVVFLSAQDDILIKRFSETRRKHPLTRATGSSLSEAINKEIQLLDAISNEAGFAIDTSHTNLHQLRDLIRTRILERDSHTMSILFQSFGFKHGVPTDADIVFDARCLPNPYWEPRLRDFSGQDQAVIKFLESHPIVHEMRKDIQTYVQKWVPRFKEADRSYLTVAVGCTGGMHRSVYLVEEIAKAFADQGQVIIRHRELE